MKYVCKQCNYNTIDKSNYNRHKNSKIHQKKIMMLTININKQSFIYQCNNCSKNYSSASSLSRHKNKYCIAENLIEKIKIGLKSEFDDKLKKKEIEFEKEKATIENKLLKDQVKKLEDFIQSGKASTIYNISVEKFIQQTYPNAPHLSKLTDYSIIEDGEEQLIRNLIDQYQTKQLDKYFGDFIISNYKKSDPTTQSIWNSDTARLTYIIKDLLANKKSSWNKDSKGINTKKYIIEPLLNHIKEVLNKYIEIYSDYVAENINQVHITDIIDYSKKGYELTNIKAYVINGQLSDDVLKYLAPHFHLNKDKNILIK